MPISSEMTTPRMANHSAGSGLCLRIADPAIAVMIGEASKNVSTAGSSVRVAENRIPSSRRMPSAYASTLSPMITTYSGLSARSLVKNARPQAGASGSRHRRTSGGHTVRPLRWRRHGPPTRTSAMETGQRASSPHVGTPGHLPYVA
jgi:hypothetical protein